MYVQGADSSRLDRLAERQAADHQVLSNVTDELNRCRQRIHDLETDRAALRLLANKVDGLTTELSELATDLRTLSRRAVERPSPGAMSAGAGWLSVGVALSALLLAVFR